jgi:Uma2 family endonuclease
MPNAEEITMSAVLEQPQIETPVAPEESPYLFSTDEFYRLLETEFFPDEARVGLWEGRIYQKMSKTQAHAVTGDKVHRTLDRALPAGWYVGVENPITVSANKAPLPDLLVLRGEPDDYIEHRPGAADVGLVIELSFSSLKLDTGAKLASYASAGITAYWVINLVDRLIHVYSHPLPAEGRFASTATIKPGESVPFALDGVQIAMIAASDLLPVR